MPRLRVAASYAPQARPAAAMSVLALISEPRPPFRYRIAPAAALALAPERALQQGADELVRVHDGILCIPSG